MHTREVISPRMKAALWIALTLIVLCLALPLVLSRASPVPLLLRLLALAVAVTIPLVLGRRRLSFMAAWLAVYVIAYGVLSWHGAYIDANLGGNDNRSIWYPAHCGEAYWSRAGRQKATLRPIGWFFLPLVLVDRWFLHPTKHDVW